MRLNAAGRCDVVEFCSVPLTQVKCSKLEPSLADLVVLPLLDRRQSCSDLFFFSVLPLWPLPSTSSPSQRTPSRSRREVSTRTLFELCTPAPVLFLLSSVSCRNSACVCVCVRARARTSISRVCPRLRGVCKAQPLEIRHVWTRVGFKIHARAVTVRFFGWLVLWAKHGNHVFSRRQGLSVMRGRLPSSRLHLVVREYTLVVLLTVVYDLVL